MDRTARHPAIVNLATTENPDAYLNDHGVLDCFLIRC